jgi:hypothetical protein
MAGNGIPGDGSAGGCEGLGCPTCVSTPEFGGFSTTWARNDRTASGRVGIYVILDWRYVDGRMQADRLAG